MWLSGGADREKWYSHRFVAGQLVEGATRDNEGKPQGTVLMEVIRSVSLETDGHWVEGRFVLASDTHFQWWMTSGAGAKVKEKCLYHFCEGPSVDCKAKKKGITIHLERFRVVTQEEVDAQSPAWAFGRGYVKAMKQYLSERTVPLDTAKKGEKLPWKEGDPEDEEVSSSTETESEGGKALKAKLKQARDELKKLERQRADRGSKKEARGKEARKAKDKKAAKAEKKKPEPAKGSGAKKRKKKEAKKKKASGSSSKGKKDRGPFGGSTAVTFQGGESSETEADFRDAPAVHKTASNQARLMVYAKKKPGRLSSRMLLKMQQESARGIVGAEGDEGHTPSVATHYLLTMMLPQLGSRLNLRSQRELRTLCLAVDLLARKHPAQAADVLSQRIKAIEKAGIDGHWGSAQYLELLSPEQSGLLEREEEVYTSKEYLLELRLKGMDKQRGRDPGKGEKEKGGKKGRERGKGKGAPQEGKTDNNSGTGLGRLASAQLEEGVPPEEDSSMLRGDDLFPINVNEVIREVAQENKDLAEAAALAVTSPNNMAFGGDPDRVPLTTGRLTTTQKMAVSHVIEALVALDESEEDCPSFDDSALALKSARFDYQGEPVMVMEDLEADKVIAAWPKVGEAAIQDATSFLTGELRDRLLSPEKVLKPLHEWPEKPHQSKVRASDSEWRKIVEAGHQRGLMVPISPDNVFRDVKGNLVLNGAGAVKKVKEKDGVTVTLQRFISNFIPSNMYQERLDGDDRLLPYLGQLCLLEQGPEEEWLIDSEDFTSCFNLFRIPPCWHQYMAFGKLVDAAAFGGTAGEMVYPAMNVLPMGWLSSVAVIQSIVRHLVFDLAGVPPSTEVAKTKPLPDDDDYTVIYLDSFDELRRLEKGCAEALEGEMSERHRAFLKVCEEKGLPLNAGKRLVASTKGTLQGGELDGKKGRYGLTFDKMAGIIGLGGALLGQDESSEFQLRHFVGKATFGMCFRRPLLSVFQEIFQEIQLLVDDGQAVKPPEGVFLDEIIQVMSLAPLMYTNLRARLDPEVSVTDASPSGGGAAVATQFRPEPWTLRDCDPRQCLECGGDIRDDDRYPCPAECGGQFCSLECVWAHRDIDHAEEGECPRRAWRPPRFGERFSGPNAPLSRAIGRQGHIEVQEPYDWYLGHDMFTESGRRRLEALMDDEYLVGEHWAPECKLFSRARGRPITLSDGRTIQGPQPVRDHKHIMGFPWLSNNMKSRVRQANNMVLKALRRGKERPRFKRWWTVEHPIRSWMWDFTLAKELDRDPEMVHSQGSCCCFGGEREKWFDFFGNLETLPAFLHRDCPGHPNLRPYEVEERADGSLRFDTADEAEYPVGLCEAYATAFRRALDAKQYFEMVVQDEFERYYQHELEQSTSRLASAHVTKAVAYELTVQDYKLRPGKEAHHLKSLLRHATFRGTDVRLHLDLEGLEGTEVHEVPYLAMRWQWRTIMAYPWRQEGHINELEVNAVAVFLKRRARSQRQHSTKFFHVLDSSVSRGALAKGRSSSKRLNKVVRKCIDSMSGRRRKSLKYVGLHPRTLKAYRTALDRFLAYTKKKHLDFTRSAHLDRCLSEFIDLAYQEGEPISYAGHLLSAIKRFHPPLRLKLPISSQFFRNWQRAYQPARAVPASWELVEAFMGVAFERREPELAVLVALGFNCLLRTSEMLSLTHKHFVFHQHNAVLSLVLPGSKTSQGNPQVLLVTDPTLVALVRTIARPRSTRLVFPRGPHVLRRLFTSYMGVLGFQPDDYAPYCLRRGGATWYFQSTLSYDATIARGRWACVKTARQYIDEGTMQLAHVSWTRSQRRLVKRWQNSCRRYRLRQE
eukprot:Skav230791  [mRNA]  locus=scaffold312:65520:71347:+ [translate_table: standard]